jgi:drug/metabolite transporter superfamily protein YnfA
MIVAEEIQVWDYPLQGFPNLGRVYAAYDGTIILLAVFRRVRDDIGERIKRFRYTGA